LFVVACTTTEDVVDPYPVRYDGSSGPIMLTISNGESGARVPAVVDVLSPITILDSFEAGLPLPTQTRRAGDLVMHGLRTDGSTVERFRFPDTNIFDLHPCSDKDALCVVGDAGSTRAIQGVVGTDVLSDHGVRFDFSARALQMFPDIAGTSATRGEVCDAVFPSPYAGGGTLLIGGAEVSFTGGRLAVGVCADYNVFIGEGSETPTYSGTDLLLLFSTAVSSTIISESAYIRYQASTDPADMVPALADLPTTTIYLPSGSVTGRAATLPRLALVGEASDLRGPCKELFANHMMSGNQCAERVTISDAVCPCHSGRFCRAGAALELNTPIDVVVISDLDDVLQALRNELRPGLAEADGILGVGALDPVVLDLDYPNNRMLARCADTTSCTARPEVRNRDSLPPIEACLGPQ